MTHYARIAAAVFVLAFTHPVKAKSMDPTCYAQIPQAVQNRAAATTKDNLGSLLTDAEAGNAEAQMALAIVYADNKLLPGNINKTLVWAQRAAEQDATGARDVLMWLQFVIAEQERAGNRQDPRDFEREWAEKGLMFAQYYYAELLNSEQKKKQAALWYEKAAEQGCMDARTKLSEMQDVKLSSGRIQAYKWISLADYLSGMNERMKAEMDYDEKRVRAGQANVRRQLSKNELEKAVKLAEQWASKHGEPYIRRQFPDDHIQYVSEEEVLPEIKRSSGYLVVHFTSFDRNCKPCLESNDVMNSLSAQRYSMVNFIRVNHEPWWEKSNILIVEHNIKGYPTTVLYQNGKERHRWLGSDVNGLMQMLDTFE